MVGYGEYGEYGECMVGYGSRLYIYTHIHTHTTHTTHNTPPPPAHTHTHTHTHTSTTHIHTHTHPQHTSTHTHAHTHPHTHTHTHIHAPCFTCSADSKHTTGESITTFLSLPPSMIFSSSPSSEKFFSRAALPNHMGAKTVMPRKPVASRSSIVSQPS
jgi:hypothetical protein